MENSQEKDKERQNALQIKIVGVATDKCIQLIGQAKQLYTLSNQTIDLLNTNGTLAFQLAECNNLIIPLYTTLSRMLTETLVAPMQQLNSAYNAFFNTVVKNLGCWQTVCEANYEALPFCVGDSKQFFEICRITSETLKEHTVTMGPVQQRLETATEGISNELFSIQAQVNNVAAEEKIKKALEESNTKSEELMKRMTQLKKEIAVAKATKAFLAKNEQNSNRQIKYLEARRIDISQQLKQIDEKITELSAQNKTTTNTNRSVEERTGRFLWWSYNSGSNSNTTTQTSKVENDVSGLQREKEALQRELNLVEEKIQKAAKSTVDLVKTMEAEVPAKEDEYEVIKKQYIVLQEQQASKINKLLIDKLETAGIEPQTSSVFIDMVHQLRFIMQKMNTLLAIMDSTQSLVTKTLNSKDLKPATVLQIIKQIYKFSVMYSVLSGGNFGFTATGTFNDSYGQFNTRVITSTVKAIEIAPPELVLKKDTEVAEAAADEAMLREMGYLS